MSEISLYPGVALAGFISFLSPCVLPLVPPYLGYLGGITIDKVIEEKGFEGSLWRRVVLSSIFFVLGFSTIFIALGASASTISQWMQSWKEIFSFIAGLIIILFGIHFLGLYRFQSLYEELRYHPELKQKSFLSSYVLGLAFGFGWTPCIGPILATILVLAANTSTLGSGIRLLAVYSLGLGLPFIMAAIAIRPFLTLLRKFKNYLSYVEKLMGLLLIVTGIAFLNISDFFSINSFGLWMLEKFPALGLLEKNIVPSDLINEIRDRSTQR
ncbi:MAG: cytochrome c biogenesis CcdA family protein [Hyphomicrobium sp.]